MPVWFNNYTTLKLNYLDILLFKDVPYDIKVSNEAYTTDLLRHMSARFYEEPETAKAPRLRKLLYMISNCQHATGNQT